MVFSSMLYNALLMDLWAAGVSRWLLGTSWTSLRDPRQMLYLHEGWAEQCWICVLNHHFRHFGLKHHCPVSNCSIPLPFPRVLSAFSSQQLQGGRTGGKGGHPVPGLCCTGKLQKMKGMAAPLPWNHSELAALPHLWFCPSINIIPFTPLGCSQLCIMLGSFWPP